MTELLLILCRMNESFVQTVAVLLETSIAHLSLQIADKNKNPAQSSAKKILYMKFRYILFL